MRILLNKSKPFIIVLVLLALCENINAQTYTITGNVNASTLSCSTFVGNNIINIGNGSASSSLIMNDDLDLRSCSLGPLQVFVNSATIDFTTANKRLYLPEGSSISFINGGTLNPAGGNGGGCTGNDRIYIGTALLAACQGSPGILGFDDIIDFGGTGATTSNSPVCVGNSINLSATPPPNGGPLTYTWYEPSVSANTSVGTGQSISITSATSGTHIYQVHMFSASLNNTMIANATVVVNSGATTATPTVNLAQPTCTLATGTIAITAPAGATYSINGLTYTNTSGVFTSLAPGTYSVTAKNSSGCISNATSVTINAQPATPVTPTITPSGSTTFCSGGSVILTSSAGSSYLWSTGATTQSISPTTTGSYTVQVTNASGCQSAASAATVVTVNPLPNAPAVGTITHPTCALATGSVVLNGLPSGSWTINPGAIAGNTTSTTISGLGTGTYNFTVTNASGCTSLASANVGIDVQPTTPTVPVLSITQPTCTLSTGTIAVTVQNIGDTYSFDNGFTFQAGNSKSGLTAGSYDIIIKSAGGCNSLAASVTIKNATNIWSGLAWSNGTPPISTENIVFNGTYTSSSDLVGCSCQVNSLVGVTIASGNTLTLTNGLTVASSGSMTFQNNASLVQINNVPNSGNINYVRTTNTVVLSTDYTYWSTPVSPQTIGSFSPKTLEGMMYSYDSNIDNWKQEYLTTSMLAGFGYIVRGPEPSAIPTPPSPYTASFVGVPHNGDYSISAIADRSYLLGNPYPSALDADTFLAANANVLNGTLYFWTHNTAIGVGVSNPGTGVYAYSGDDYATYNATGGVGAAPPDSGSTTGSAPSDPGHPVPPSLVDNGKIPTGKIASGQGFFASTKTSISGTSIIYENNMRVGVGGITGSNSQFFKTRNPKEKIASPIEKNRVWLNLTNAQGAFKQTLVGYVTDATNDYDSRFDGESFDGNEFVDFYSINQDVNLTIQGRALPFDQNDEVPLGYRTTIDGAFTINIDQVDGLLTNQAVFLEDKLTNTIFDLKKGNYTFQTVAGTFDDRFVLRYVDKSSSKTLDVGETVANDGIIVLYSNNYKTLIVKNNIQDATVYSVILYNMLGQKITDWDIEDKEQTSIQIPIKNISPEIYIIKVKTTKGETTTKIVIR